MTDRFSWMTAQQCSSAVRDGHFGVLDPKVSFSRQRTLVKYPDTTAKRTFPPFAATAKPAGSRVQHSGVRAETPS